MRNANNKNITPSGTQRRPAQADPRRGSSQGARQQYGQRPAQYSSRYSQSVNPFTENNSGRHGAAGTNTSRKAKTSARRRTDKAYSKAMRERSTAPTHRRRVGNYSHYYFAFGVIAVIIFVVLANTVLFRCGSVTVEGTQRYSAEEIIAASGLKTGDNLLHIDTGAAEKKIIEQFAYIDSASVRKKYPTGLEITVGEAEQWFCVEQDGETAVVSRLGKLIDKAAPASLVRVAGYEAASMEIGDTLTSLVEGKQELPAKILASAEYNNMRGLTEIDLTDRFNIELNLYGRIVVRIGDTTDLDEKLYSAVSVINKSVSDTERVYVDVRITDQVIIGNMAEQNALPEIPTEPETKESGGE